MPDSDFEIVQMYLELDLSGRKILEQIDTVTEFVRDTPTRAPGIAEII